MYSWLVFLHLVGVVLFAISHGVSAWMAFRIRRDHRSDVVASHLAASEISKGPLYGGLLLIAIGGLGAAWTQGWLLDAWAIGSYVVLAIVLAVMYSVASPYYGGLRQLVGDGTGLIDQAELDRALDSRRPDILVTVGTLGLLTLVWLMVFRPGL